jgi:predicted Zn-dependent protease
LTLALMAFACFGAASHAAGAGAKFYQELLEQDGLYPDEAWQAYVDAIGQRLLAVTPDAGKEYHFYVLDSTSVNAMAFPDAYIFVNRGLIAYLRSEDELAAVIGHEIGHVVGAHAKRSNRTAQLGNIAGFIGSILTGTGAISDLSNSATSTLVTGYRREYELEADELGGEYLAKAGYNPLAIIDTIHVLKDHSLFSKHVLKQPTVYHGLFSTHPKNDKRLYEAVQKSQNMFPEELMEPVGDFWSMIDGLVYGSEATAGLIKGSTYYHGGFRVVVTFPTDWDVVNKTVEILGQPITGSTDSSIAIQRSAAPQAGQTPEQYLVETLKRDDLANGEAVEINGFSGYIADIDLAGSSDQARKIAVVFKDGNAYVFRGELGSIGDPKAFQQNWLETVNSFRAMTAADLKVANNQRVAVVVAKPSDSFASLARKSSLKSYPEETLRVINGMHPVGEPRAGDYVKIVQ